MTIKGPTEQSLKTIAEQKSDAELERVLLKALDEIACKLECARKLIRSRNGNPATSSLAAIRESARQVQVVAKILADRRFNRWYERRRKDAAGGTAPSPSRNSATRTK